MDISFNGLITFENIYKAWQRFRLGKSHRADVIMFERELEKNLLAILCDLKNGTYTHGGYQTFELRDSKRRRIDKASVRDRVVHELLFRFLETVFEPVFIFDSYSSRVGKGTLRALVRLEKFLAPWRNGLSNWYVVLGDVRSFFASIPHNLLLRLLLRRVLDARLLDLCEKVIRSFPTDGCLDYGMPLGNVTSQIFSNVVMHEFDWEVKERFRLRRYVRYNDDVVVAVRGLRSARDIKSIFHHIARAMGFDMKTQVVELNNQARFNWLGAMHFRFGRVLRADTSKRVHHSLRRARFRLKKRLITENLYRNQVVSYFAHTKNYAS
jgi:retron-type reverse transcriptase